MWYGTFLGGASFMRSILLARAGPALRLEKALTNLRELSPQVRLFLATGVWSHVAIERSVGEYHRGSRLRKLAYN